MMLQTLPREIQLLDQAADNLAQCEALDELKSHYDRAEAIELYQKKIDKSGRATIAAAMIKLLAMRRMGEILAKMEKNKGGGDHRSQRGTGGPTLKDIGISKMESSRYQLIAAVPEEEFHATIAAAERAGRAPTASELCAKGRSHKRMGSQAVNRTKSPARTNGEAHPSTAALIKREPVETVLEMTRDQRADVLYHAFELMDHIEQLEFLQSALIDCEGSSYPRDEFLVWLRTKVMTEEECETFWMELEIERTGMPPKETVEFLRNEGRGE
jgi:hypothetical protein